VFNSRGAVIGVVTRKSAEQESLAFCIPVEELNLAIDKVVTLPRDAIERDQSRHRLVLAVKELAGSGALYSSVISLRRQKGAGGPNAAVATGFYDAAVAHLEKQTFPRLRAEVARIKDDPLVPEPLHQKVGRLADNLEKLKAVYTAGNPPKDGNDSFPALKATHRRLVLDLCKTLKLDVPGNILFILDESSGNGGASGASKDRHTSPDSPKNDKAKTE
jgi:hypothetical protein